MCFEFVKTYRTFEEHLECQVHHTGLPFLDAYTSALIPGIAPASRNYPMESWGSF